jgi:hypothetical protein
MTKRLAFAIDAVVGCSITWGSVLLLSMLGANEDLQLVAAMTGLSGTSLMVGVIGVHYARKREAQEGKNPDAR